MPDVNNTDVQLALLKASIDRLSCDLGEIKTDVKALKNDYVARLEFDPIKKLVYGAVGLVLVSVLTALLYLVVRTT